MMGQARLQVAMLVCAIVCMYSGLPDCKYHSWMCSELQCMPQWYVWYYMVLLHVGPGSHGNRVLVFVGLRLSAVRSHSSRSSIDIDRIRRTTHHCVFVVVVVRDAASFAIPNCQGPISLTH